MISTLILIIYLYYCIHKCASMSPAFVHKHILINTCIMCLLYRLFHSHINSCFIWGAGRGGGIQNPLISRTRNNLAKKVFPTLPGILMLSHFELSEYIITWA